MAYTTTLNELRKEEREEAILVTRRYGLKMDQVKIIKGAFTIALESKLDGRIFHTI